MTSAEWVEGAVYAAPLSEQGPAPKEVVVGFGFWLFLLSDIVIFAALFAAWTHGRGPKGTADGAERGISRRSLRGPRFISPISPSARSNRRR